MKKIRILFSIPNFDTAGSGKALLNIAKGLDSNFFESHIMCLHNRGEFFKVVESSGLPIHILNFTTNPRPISKMFKECWTVSRTLKEIAPDVIHSYHYSSDYTEAIASHLAGIPWVFTKKNMNWGGKSENAWKLRSYLAKKIVVQNLDMLTKFYNGSKKTVLIPRGVDVSYFRDFEAVETVNLVPKFSSGQRILICVANFVPVKGIELSIQALNRLKDKYQNWSLLLVGDDQNKYGQELHEMVIALGLEGRVKFSGKLVDIRPQLNRAEIFILSTKEKGEGSPVALLEAMANGKIVIGSNIPGIKDQLSKFPDSLFEASDLDGLTARLDHYMGKSKRELKNLGNSFSRHVSLDFPMEKEIERHESLYKSILKK